MNTEPTRFWWAAVGLRQCSYGVALLTLCSWHTQCLLFWSRRPSQHTRYRSPRSFSGRLVRPLQPAILSKDGGHGGEADGMIPEYDFTRR